MLPHSIYEEFDKDYQQLEPPIVTNSYRKLANQYHKRLKVYSLEGVFSFCERLLQENKRGYSVVAYQLADKRHKDFTKETFERFDHWVHSFLQDWGDCDDFMTHAMGRLYLTFPELWPKIKQWTNSDNFAVRRATAVVLLPAAKTGELDISRAFEVCNTLIDDEHYLVQKGFGWLLKEATKHYHDEVVTYLEQNVSKLSRTAFRYAIEKLDRKEKKRLMSL